MRNSAEACHVFVHQQVALGPVGIAMGDGVGVALIAGLQIVKTDFHVMSSTEQHDGGCAPFAIHFHLHGFDAWGEADVLLCEACE